MEGGRATAVKCYRHYFHSRRTFHHGVCRWGIEAVEFKESVAPSEGRHSKESGQWGARYDRSDIATTTATIITTLCSRTCNAFASARPIVTPPAPTLLVPNMPLKVGKKADVRSLFAQVQGNKPSLADTPS
jgi:hypothetical protein